MTIVLNNDSTVQIVLVMPQKSAQKLQQYGKCASLL